MANFRITGTYFVSKETQEEAKLEGSIETDEEGFFEDIVEEEYAKTQGKKEVIIKGRLKYKNMSGAYLDFMKYQEGDEQTNEFFSSTKIGPGSNGTYHGKLIALNNPIETNIKAKDLLSRNFESSLDKYNAKFVIRNNL